MIAPPLRADRLLVDSNLLVLFVVGSVNRLRIEHFKRTRRYTVHDFDLLVNVLGKWGEGRLYTIAHILAEVSNLTDLAGAERAVARGILMKTISELEEPHVSSLVAASSPAFGKLGLTDAAIVALAHSESCTVLTDDLDLYLELAHRGTNVINFTHLRAQAFGL